MAIGTVGRWVGAGEGRGVEAAVTGPRPSRDQAVTGPWQGRGRAVTGPWPGHGRAVTVPWPGHDRIVTGLHAGPRLDRARDPRARALDPGRAAPSHGTTRKEVRVAV